MTPEIRAVLDAAYRVSANADVPDSPRFGEALHELDSALAALDRVEPETFHYQEELLRHREEAAKR